MQSYASVCILLSGKRPKPLMLQAWILNRSLFETLTNVIALIEEPTRIDILDRDAYRSMALRYIDQRQLFGDDPQWKEYLEVYSRSLAVIAKQIGLSADLVEEPSKIVVEWPTPGRLIFGQPSRGIPPWVSGERRAVLKRLYESNYSHQSELAHQRVAAVSAANACRQARGAVEPRPR